LQSFLPGSNASSGRAGLGGNPHPLAIHAKLGDGTGVNWMRETDNNISALAFGIPQPAGLDLMIPTDYEIAGTA
jgi:hypothetical protein